MTTTRASPWGVVIGVAIAGALAAAFVPFLPDSGRLAGHAEALFAVGYALVFLVAQRGGFLLQWRGHATKISIEEFALVGGVLLLPPVSLVAAVVASALAHQILARRPIEKAIFNVGQYALSASLAIASVVGLVLAGAE